MLDASYYPSDIRIPDIEDTDEAYDALNSALAVNFNTIHAVRKGKTVGSAEKQTPIMPLAISQFRARGPKGRGRISLTQDPAVGLQYAGELIAASGQVGPQPKTPHDGTCEDTTLSGGARPSLPALRQTHADHRDVRAGSASSPSPLRAAGRHRDEYLMTPPPIASITLFYTTAAFGRRRRRTSSLPLSRPISHRHFH